MKFTMNVQDLIESLNIITRALAARPANQILEGILIRTEDNRVRMICSDGNLTIQAVNAANITEEGETVIPGRLFYELIRKLPGEEVSITINDTRTALIKSKNSKTNISCMNHAEYPEIKDLTNGIEIKIPQKKLKDMINHITFAIATDETRQILTGSLFEVSRSEARMVALDGFRLSMQKIFQPFELPESMNKFSAIIVGKVLTELGRILQDDDSFCNMFFENGRMQANFGNISLSSVLLSGEYIDYRKILPNEFKTEVRAKKQDVQDSIDRASLMAKEGKNNLVRMSFSENNLTISSKAELGNVTEDIEAYVTGNPIDIAFNSKYINDIIRNIDDDEIRMKLNTSVSPCVIVPETGDSYLYLILPVRVFS